MGKIVWAILDDIGCDFCPKLAAGFFQAFLEETIGNNSIVAACESCIYYNMFRDSDSGYQELSINEYVEVIIIQNILEG